MKDQNMFSGYQEEQQGDKKTTLPIVKLLGISSILSYILLLTWNGYIGQNIGRVSSQVFPVIVTPPGLFFAIWSVIFVLLFASLCLVYWYSAWNIKTFLSLYFYFATYIIWMYFFSTGTKYGLVICTFDIFLITFSLFLIWKYSFDIDDDSKAQKFIRQSIAFQMGWTASASCLNLCIFLVYICEMSQQSICFLIWIYLGLAHSLISLLAYKQAGSDKIKFIQNFGLYYASCSWALIGFDYSQVYQKIKIFTYVIYFIKIKTISLNIIKSTPQQSSRII
ncbi:hypothetical protein pb186bvf_003044 [Paramecium bursaria]